MSHPEGSDVERDKARTESAVETLQLMMLSNDIIYDRIELDSELDACLVFVSTRNISAVEIAPLEAIAKEVNARLSSVIDSARDQLCFFFVFD